MSQDAHLDLGYQPVASTSKAGAAGAPPEGVASAPHEMRISTQGSLKSYVRFALKFLQEPHDRPLVLHTLPPLEKPSYAPKLSGEIKGDKERDVSALKGMTEEPAAPTPAPLLKKNAVSTKTIGPATLQIPRLISVVEIIKREYIELIVASSSSLKTDDEGQATKKRKKGLWQYNQTGCLEDLVEYKDYLLELNRKGKQTAVEDDEEEQEKLDVLRSLLGGKSGIKMKHSPYMKVTLSTSPMELPKESMTTSQQISIPKSTTRSKAKARKLRKVALKKKRDQAANAVSSTPVSNNQNSKNKHLKLPEETAGGKHGAVGKRALEGAATGAEETQGKKKKPKLTMVD